MKKETKIIAPRLANGDRRVSYGAGLPESIKQGLRDIAAEENKSVSWVMEQVIIRFFGLREPKYKKRSDKRDVELENW